MNDKTKKRICGSISVLLVIILLPMMTFSALIVDMSRINMAKQMMSSAGDLTMNAALANYDTILKDVYGLFAMSQIQGLDSEEMGQKIENYFIETITGYGVVSEEEAPDYVENMMGDLSSWLADVPSDTTNFLQLDNIKVDAQGVSGSELAKAGVLRKQIVEYMKYRAPIGLGLSFLESLDLFKNASKQSDVVEAQVKAQESTQDVTNACSQLIKLVREYDDLVLRLNTSVTGSLSSSDGIVVPIESYGDQVSKYLSSWGENYTHINKLNLVFLANSPSVDSVYLSKLSYAGNVFFVKTGGTGVVYTNSGIDLTINAAANTTAARDRVYAQITHMNDTCLQYANAYSTVMVPKDNLNKDFLTNARFADGKEDAAVGSFIAFEKFLLNQSGNITYDQVRNVLEQIYTLGQYYDDYKKKIDADVKNAKAEVDKAQGRVNDLTKQRDNAQGAMKKQAENVNKAILDYKNACAALDPQVQPGAYLTNAQKSVLNDLYVTSYTGNEAAMLKFKTCFDEVVKKYEEDGNKTEEKICKAAKNFATKGGNRTFEAYMKKECGSSVTDEDLYRLLNFLNTCIGFAKGYSGNLKSYSDAKGQLPDAQAVLSRETTKWNNLKGERTDVTKDYQACLSGYHTFCKNYQADAYYYNYYTQAAKNTVEAEAKAVQAQFSQIIKNVKDLADKLEAISDQIGTVKEEIKTYGDNLTTWEKENKSYESVTNGDSFSKQNTADIEKARKEYNPELYDTLDKFVIALWNEFDGLHTQLDAASNFLYGTKQIKSITTAKDLKDAVANAGLSAVVTPEEATQKLSQLYVAQMPDSYVPYTVYYQEADGTETKQLCFLEPKVVPLQALTYLNSAYPEKTAEKEAENKAVYDDYQTQKDKLTGKNEGKAGSSSGGSVESSNNDTVGYGYTYNKDKTIPDSRPSKSGGAKEKTATDEEYKLKEEGEGDEAKLNASESVGKQSSNLDSILEGLGSVATTAVENLYILNYIFENFSYNTIVQEQLVKDNSLTSGTVVGQSAEVATLKNNSDAMKAAKEKLMTLSNIPINEYNNYLFGGEVEYILFGSADPAKNVTYAKASIYGIRFVFNCIYAFTDSTIRNSTMAAGLAVQAATLGIVPYQVVQIVLQLALAAAESAVDLAALSNGLSVAVIKTKDTWSLSVSGAGDMLKDAANAAANVVSDKLSNLAQEGIGKLTEGLNGVIDATADELVGAVEELRDSLDESAKGLLNSVADQVLAGIMAELEKVLNGLPYVKGASNGDGTYALPTQEQIQAYADAAFAEVRGKLDAIVNEACGENEMAQAALSTLKDYANLMITNVESEVNTAISGAEFLDGKDIVAHITEKMVDLKKTLVNSGMSFVSGVSGKLSGIATEQVKKYQQELTSYIDGVGEDLSEQAADAIKEKVSGFADKFTEQTLKLSNTGVDTSAGMKESKMSMFKFSYKDYLMLLTYISICTGDSALLRTADLIELNISKAGEKATYQHGLGAKFKLTNAYTYVSVTATAELDMFFMNLSLFSDMVSEDGENGSVTAEEGNGTWSALTYKGLLGY